jgi:hypothetical protein
MIAFLDGVLGEIKDEFEEEAQYISKEGAACAIAIRTAAEPFKKKLSALAKLVSSQGMESLTQQVARVEEVFGRTAAAKIVGLAEETSTLVRAEAKKAARSAMAELQRRILHAAINTEDQLPALVHSLSSLQSVRRSCRFEILSGIRK